MGQVKATDDDLKNSVWIALVCYYLLIATSIALRHPMWHIPARHWRIMLDFFTMLTRKYLLCSLLCSSTWYLSVLSNTAL